jgi:hypothetical protein
MRSASGDTGRLQVYRAPPVELVKVFDGPRERL